MVWLIALGLGGVGLAPTLGGAAARAQAQVQVQLGCSGTLFDARGSAELKRPIERLRLSLGVEAEAPSAAAALTLLQERLAAVRQALQLLQVQELRVTSPSTWSGSGSSGKPPVFAAASQVSGQLAPQHLQDLISQIGGLPGVRLAPIDGQAAQASDAVSNRRLVQAAYADALRRGQDLAAALGLNRLRPLQVKTDGGLRPVPLRAMALARPAPAPFDPRELPEPSDSLSLEVTFCATP